MNRKGPDGRTLPPSGDEETEDTTRRMPKRSIRDRIAGAEDSAEETRAVHRPVPTEQTDEQDAGAYAETRLTASAATHPSAGGGGDAQDTVPNRDAGQAAPDDAAATDPGAPAGPAAGGDPPPAPQGASQAASPAAPSSVPPADADVTQVYRPNRNKGAPSAAPGAPQEEDVAEEEDLVADPVVGWLVVIDGPGRGSALTIGYGNNRIGRDAGEDIVLDFGDGQISRENHAVMTYDGKNKKFYIQQGGGRNLTHVNEDLVLTPMELSGGETIQMGDTKLKFVPLCGSDFDWYDE